MRYPGYCHCRLCQGFYAAPAAALLGLPEDCVQLSLAEGSEVRVWSAAAHRVCV